MPTAGEVHYVPKELSLASDSRDRRHVLLHDCEGEALGSVAYASRQATQHAFGAACAIITPRAADVARGVEANGFVKKTYVFPGALTPVNADLLDDAQGRLSAAELARVRGQVPVALSFGAGTCWSVARPSRSGTAPTSRRGSIVGFGPELAAQLRGDDGEGGLAFGIILTPHALSVHPHAYQAVVPVLTDFEPLNDEELEVAEEPWLRALGPDVSSALILVPEAFHVHPSALLRLTHEYVVPPTTMARIEATLRARLLSPTPALAQLDSCGDHASAADVSAQSEG